MKNIVKILCLTIVAGCGSSYGSSIKLPKETTIHFSSIPSCNAQGECACRPLLAAGPSKPEEGISDKHKRFEFRIPKTYSSIWVDIEGHGQFYKPGNEIDASCFYVDLVPGEYKVTFHAAQTDPSEGLKIALDVAEYGPAIDEIGPFWYPSFEIFCSNGNRCTKEGIKYWAEYHAKHKEGRLNPCSTSRARGIEYTGKSESVRVDGYKDLTIQFTLDIGYLPAKGDPTSPDCASGF